MMGAHKGDVVVVAAALKAISCNDLLIARSLHKGSKDWSSSGVVVSKV